MTSQMCEQGRSRGLNFALTRTALPFADEFGGNVLRIDVLLYVHFSSHFEKKRKTDAPVWRWSRSDSMR